MAREIHLVGGTGETAHTDDAASAPPVEEVPTGTDQPPGKAPESPMMDLFSLDADKATDDVIRDLIRRQVESNIQAAPVLNGYNVLLFFDQTSIGSSDANRLYSALAGVDREKPILLILSSPGGDIAAAYFIAKLCHEYTTKTFEVAVPRQAKSAATLICCGADKIHMGSLSELGPIDPQFGSVPALALKQSVEHIAELVSDHPGSAEMFSEYLHKALKIESLGYYERVAESATQYATRLLGSRRTVPEEKQRNEQIARRLVYEYKDHGFAIDQLEALDIFGTTVVACNTDVYRAANEISQTLEIATWLCDSRYGRSLTYIGSAASGCWTFRKRRR